MPRHDPSEPFALYKGQRVLTSEMIEEERLEVVRPRRDASLRTAFLIVAVPGLIALAVGLWRLL